MFIIRAKIKNKQSLIIFFLQLTNAKGYFVTLQSELKNFQHESQSRLCKYYRKAKCRKINAYERICRRENFYRDIESADHQTSNFGYCERR